MWCTRVGSGFSTAVTTAGGNGPRALMRCLKKSVGQELAISIFSQFKEKKIEKGNFTLYYVMTLTDRRGVRFFDSSKKRKSKRNTLNTFLKFHSDVTTLIDRRKRSKSDVHVVRGGGVEEVLQGKGQPHCQPFITYDIAGITSSTARPIVFPRPEPHQSSFGALFPTHTEERSGWWNKPIARKARRVCLGGGDEEEKKRIPIVVADEPCDARIFRIRLRALLRWMM